MKAVDLKNISKSFQLPSHFPKHKRDFWALKGITLNVEQGRIAGIIGRNGSGKTTLLKIISGMIQPTDGVCEVKGRLCPLFTLGAGFQDALNGKENIFLNGSLLSMTDSEIKNKYRNIVEFSGLDEFISLPLGSYSQGMRLRLGFSVAAHTDFDILVIDEVLLVGDAAFQNRCFEKLKDFRRQNKTMLITTQSLDLIERLCDDVFLLENGKLVKQGPPEATINAYRKILNDNQNKLRGLEESTIVTKTKWWADEKGCWGTKEGTKEVIIENVEIANRWGNKTNRFRVGENVKIKVNFIAKDKVVQPHFGVAIFREDGVYCYGPNTSFEGYTIKHIHPGRGWFVLEYKNMQLAPGSYYLSVSIWDKKEVLAYDYHKYFYKIEILGENNNQQLAHLRSSWDRRFGWNGNGSIYNKIDLSQLKTQWLRKIVSNMPAIDSLKLCDQRGQQRDTFFTGEKMQVALNLSSNMGDKNHYIWCGIYREDLIFCHAVARRLHGFNQKATLVYPELNLLPGRYRLSLGIWDQKNNAFLSCNHGGYPFNIIFNRPDHGTVYLKHKWKWKLPQGK